MDNNENMNVMELNEENLEAVSGGKGSGNKVKATGDVWVRRRPNKTSEQIGLLYNGDVTTYQHEKEYDDRGVAWYKVKFNGKNGWVSSRYSKIV